VVLQEKGLDYHGDISRTVSCVEPYDDEKKRKTQLLVDNATSHRINKGNEQSNSEIPSTESDL
jgi:hypothetical protein